LSSSRVHCGSRYASGVFGRIVAFCLHGWPQDKLRDLLPDRMLAAHPELYVGDRDALPLPAAPRALKR
jgi:hypothetical protein